MILVREKEYVVKTGIAVEDQAFVFHVRPEVMVAVEIRCRGGWDNSQGEGGVGFKSRTVCDEAVVVFVVLLTDCPDEEPRVDANDGQERWRKKKAR